MEPLITKVQNILRASFSGAELDLEETVPGERIGGSCTWTGFLGMEQIDRQHMLWKVLRKSLTPREQSQLGLILTFTPPEVAAMEEALAA
ncbi:MAG: hypothetical protein JO250_19770 [Armatimonadetes bacterium]|nr:hypothetical protein [Armatimonadota bacterium]